MAQLQFEFKKQSPDDGKYDTSENTERLKGRCARLAQAAVTATAEARLQDMPQQELGAVVRELRSRGIETEIYSMDKEDAIVEYNG